MVKVQEKLQARKLREQGLGITTIAKQLKIPCSTISVWCQNIELTDEQKRVLTNNSHKGFLYGNEVLRQKRIERQKEFRQQGESRVGPLSVRELFLVGAALYWGEGGKARRVVVFSNANSTMIQIGVKWLMKCFDVPLEKMRFHLHIHEAQLYYQKELEDFWKGVVGSDAIFYKTSIDKRTDKKKKGIGYKQYRGTLGIYVNDATLYDQIMGAIEGLGRYSLVVE